MKCKEALEAENCDFEKAHDRLRKEGLKTAESKASRRDLRRARLRARREGRPLGHDRGRALRDGAGVEDADVPGVRRQAPRPGREGVAEGRRGAPRPPLDRRRGRRRWTRPQESRREDRREHEGHDRVPPGDQGQRHGRPLRPPRQQARGARRRRGREGHAELKEAARQLAMHVVFARPVAGTRQEVAADAVERERAIYKGQVAEDPR